MPWYGWFIVSFVALIIAIVVIVKLVQLVAIARTKGQMLLDSEEKMILDECESALREYVENGGADLKSLKPLVHRKHDHYLQLMEQDCDEKSAILTPTVVIQFNQETRDIELRLYVRRFFRGKGYLDNQVKTKYFEYDIGYLGSAMKEAIALFKVGFAD